MLRADLLKRDLLSETELVGSLALLVSSVVLRLEKRFRGLLASLSNLFVSVGGHPGFRCWRAGWFGQI